MNEEDRANMLKQIIKETDGLVDTLLKKKATEVPFHIPS